MKKLFTFLFALTASVGIASAQSGTCGDNLTWEFDAETGILTISGTGAMADYILDIPWYEYRSSIQSVIITDGVTTIGDNAFYDCSSLTSVTIPNSVTSIGNQAFNYCNGLTSVTIPNSVTSMGNYPFAYCSGLTNIVVEDGNPKYDSRENCNAIIETLYDDIVAGCRNTIIPSSVKSLQTEAFEGCSGLTAIEIPNGVTSMGHGVFRDCTGLTSITIPNSVTSIGVGVISGCYGLTNIVVEDGNSWHDSRDNCNAIIETASNTLVAGCQNTTIPYSVTSIGYEAFAYCSSLTSVTIPNSVTSIEYGAFHDCTGLTSLTCKATTPPTLGSSVFNNVNKSIPLYVPAQSVDLYKAADQWKDFSNILPIPGTDNTGIGVFSVSPTEKVAFSPGNLQYNAALGNHQCADGTTQPGTWRFAEHQWDIVGMGYGQINISGDYYCYIGGTVADGDNRNISSTYSGWIDLFGWATSGWNGGAVAYEPWSTSISTADYNPGVSAFNNLTGEYANADWGVYNQIGKDTSNHWRTLTIAEWDYLKNAREDAQNKYGAAKVNGITGVVVLPDIWTLPASCSFTPGMTSASWYDWSQVATTNIYSVEQWAMMEEAGAVFLPCAGIRTGTSVNNVGTSGYYWSSTAGSYNGAQNLHFDSNFPGLGYGTDLYRYLGFSVRLVTELSDTPTYTLAVSVEGEGTVTGAGEYKSGTTATLTATPASGYLFSQWSDGNTDNPRSLILTQDTTLKAEFELARCLLASGICGLQGDNLTWELSCDGVLTISGTGAMADYASASNVPWYDDYRSTITTILITDGVTSIGDNVFFLCKSLTSVTIPNSVTSIGEDAFGGCDALTSITIPNSVTSIGKRAFEYCYSLTSVTIPNSVTSIGEFAFYYCIALTSVTIGNSVTSIGDWAFSSCSSLTSITFEAITPPTIGDLNVFFNTNNCPIYVPCGTKDAYVAALIEHDIDESRVIEKTFIASGYCGADSTNLTWELSCDSVLTISGTGAMADYTYNSYAPWYDYRSSIQSVIITDGVTSIGQYDFYYCSSLTSVTIPNSVTSIGSQAFYYCSKLTSVTIPNSVTSIGEDAFRGCSSLTSVTIPNSVTSIGGHAFYNCSSLTSITIPNSVTSIGSHAFYGCSSLTSVTIPDSVTSIGSGAFYSCKSLTSVVIPNSVTSIGSGAFDGCSSLTSVTFESITPPIIKKGVHNTNNCPIYVPCGTKEAYVAALNVNNTIDESRVIEKLPYTYSILTSDSTLGSVTITQEPTCTEPVIFRADAAEGYQFTQWSDGNTDNPRSLILTQDTTIKAEFELCTYTVTWLNYDSLVLELDTNVIYGTMPSYDSAVPAKPSTAEYTYTFAGWSPVVESVTGNTTYIAVFDEVLNAYTVTWLNYDSLVLELDTNVIYGTMPSYDGTLPAKPSTAEYTYTFAGWSPVVESVTGYTTYIAVFDEVLNAYTVTWLNYDSLVLELDTNVAYGTMPSYDSAVPAKPSTAEYTYTFAGWSPKVVATTEDATYTATYTSALRMYSVLVYGMNDNIILNGTYPYGESILVEAIPEQNYQFAQWSDGNTDNPRSLILTQDTTLKALFEQIIIEQDTIIVTDSTDISDIIPDGQDTIPHVEVQPGGEITIDRDDIGIGVITIITIGTESGQVHPWDGGYDNLKNTRVVMEYVLEPLKQQADPNKWYAFAVPFKVDIETGITRKYGNKSHVPGKDFMILEYDSYLRSTTGKGWKEKKSGLLEPGHFYMLGIEGNCNRWLFEKVRNADVVGDKEKDLQHYAHGNSKNNGWHGLGNTTLEYVDMSFDGLNATYVYTYDNQYGKYNIYSIEELILAVGQPFFTQGDNDGSVAFTPNNGKGKGNGKKNMPIYAPSYDVQPSHPRVLLTIETEKINATPDRLYITLHDDNQCGSYRIGRDFMRMDKGSKQVPNFWCPMADGTQLSAHGISMPTTYTTIPLGIFTPAKGEYTINAHMQDMDDYIVELYYQNVCLGIVMQGVPFRLEMAAGTSYDYSIRISRRVSTDLNPAEDTQCDKDNKWYDVLGRPLPQDAHGIFIRKGEKIIK